MRTLKFFGLVSSFLLINLLSLTTGNAECHQISFDPKANYVVIGAFAVHDNAIRFTSHAKELKLDARYQLNPNRNLYYVYVLTTEDRETAISEARRLRSESEFYDAWVYGGLLGTNMPGEDINPVTEQSISVTQVESAELATSVAGGSLLPTAEAESNEIAEEESASEEDDAALGTKFLFNIFRASDQEKMEGDVEVIDVERSRKLATYKGNAPVRISPPDNSSGSLSLVCEVFGYRKVQKDINYNEPQGQEISTDADGNVVVPFELVRLKKGDIAIMYHVYFYKDAGVMRPESRYEVSSLLDMLNENPNYRIKLHGHTNGGAAGKIISMGKSKNFFSLNDTKEGVGSAKKLSQERAEVIREYLINEGVNPNRIEIKAWGGKRPIHDKNSTRAQENVRVEVEILED